MEVKWERAGTCLWSELLTWWDMDGCSAIYRQFLMMLGLTKSRRASKSLPECKHLRVLDIPWFRRRINMCLSISMLSQVFTNQNNQLNKLDLSSLSGLQTCNDIKLQCSLIVVIGRVSRICVFCIFRSFFIFFWLFWFFNFFCVIFIKFSECFITKFIKFMKTVPSFFLYFSLSFLLSFFLLNLYYFLKFFKIFVYLWCSSWNLLNYYLKFSSSRNHIYISLFLSY